MKKHLLCVLMLLTAPFALTGCSDNDDLTGGDSGHGTSTEAPLRTITCLAAGEGNAESGRNQVKHPTTLMSHSVLWDKGDQFQIIQDGSNDYVFDATVSTTSCGIGISVPNTYTTAYVRYSDIKVYVNDADVTANVATNSTGNNTYKMGTYSEGGSYRYAPANTVITLTLNTKNAAIPLVQTSSSSNISSSNKGRVVLTNVEYSFDQQNWTKLTSEDQINNGFNGKNSGNFSVYKIADYVLEATVTAKSSGLGITVSQATGTAQVRYKDIKVEIGGTDMTSTIATTANTTNAYYLGLYNETGSVYRYAPKNMVMSVDYKNSVIPLIQTGSKSSITTDTKAHVVLKGVEYSLNNGTSWTALTQESQLSNGFNTKNKVDHSLFEDKLDVAMTLTGEAGHTVGTFTGTTASSASLSGAMAVFPASAYKSVESGNLQITLPAIQTYVAESFDHQANVMVGSVAETGANECNASFKNMCGLLRLALTGDNVALSHITITDKADKSLAGTATLSTADYATTGITTDMLSGSSTLTLKCEGVTLTSEPTYFYFVVPVGAFSSGFEATVTTTDSRAQTISTSKDNTISRNGIKAMPQIAIDKLTTASFNVENDAVQKFMSYGKYDRFGATSYFTSNSSELNQALCMNQDRPAEYSVALPSSGSYTATLTDDTKDKDIYTDRAFTGSKYAFYNMVPGHTYTYTIKSGSTTIKSGTFKAGGLVRMVRIDDSFNCRDLGGWTGLNGHKVAYEWIYRTGSLNGQWQLGSNGAGATSTTIADASNYRFSEAGKQQVRDLGILSELDLRGRTGDDGLWSGESGIHSRSILEPHIPIATADFKQIMTDLGLQNPLSNSAVVKDVAFIIDQVVNKNHPVAFHCKSGADRTGAVGMLILSLLGVDQGDVARDYELTTMSREKFIFTGSSAYQERLASNTSYSFFKNGFTTSSCQGNNAQEKAYYYLNQYFKESGVAISAADIDAFIKKMLGLSSYTHPTWATNNGNSLSTIYNN